MSKAQARLSGTPYTHLQARSGLAAMASVEEVLDAANTSDDVFRQVHVVKRIADSYRGKVHQ